MTYNVFCDSLLFLPLQACLITWKQFPNCHRRVSFCKPDLWNFFCLTLASEVLPIHESALSEGVLAAVLYLLPSLLATSPLLRAGFSSLWQSRQCIASQPAVIGTHLPTKPECELRDLSWLAIQNAVATQSRDCWFSGHST